MFLDKAKQLYEAIYNIIAPDQVSLYEMTNLSKKHTGLDYNIFISSRGGAKHGPRVKVSNVLGKFDFDNSFSVSVDHEPTHRSGTVRIPKEHLDNVRDWIKLNHDHLHKIWHSDSMDCDDHKTGLKRLP